MLEQKQTQEQRILEYLEKNGSINRIKALYDIAIFELSARITSLERKGYKFNKERKKDKNRYNETVRFVEYSLCEV